MQVLLAGGQGYRRMSVISHSRVASGRDCGDHDSEAKVRCCAVGQ